MKKSKKILIILNIVIFFLNAFWYYAFCWPEMKTTIDKPILYLYPEAEQEITVKLEHEEDIKTSYPQYTNGWQVLASPSGNLKIGNKNYYALYWDEYSSNHTNFKEGFYVTKETALTFLEDKLNIIGLNERERNEFIMYWLPILEDNKKSLVYFELTEEREQNNKLIITPKPDSLLRVVIHIKKANHKYDIKEQELPSFKRTGFVAVEWGGTTYN